MTKLHVPQKLPGVVWFEKLPGAVGFEKPPWLVGSEKLPGILTSEREINACFNIVSFLTCYCKETMRKKLGNNDETSLGVNAMFEMHNCHKLWILLMYDTLSIIRGNKIFQLRNKL